MSRVKVVTYVRRDGQKSNLMRTNPCRNRYLIPLHCKQCGVLFFATRADALTCSGACRVEKHRAEKAAKKAEKSNAYPVELL